ncbi:hypothetical protein [Paenibacillus sp. ISL-20]|uniref:hypothetical protein n=1 Tax=Paenibacillus sp. ISL-20 TaxID=2819163 RepID=UPI001BE6E1E7|nr:hypothetical protein [Paenibacillus sp. ISL-20]
MIRQKTTNSAHKPTCFMEGLVSKILINISLELHSDGGSAVGLFANPTMAQRSENIKQRVYFYSRDILLLAYCGRGLWYHAGF